MIVKSNQIDIIIVLVKDGEDYGGTGDSAHRDRINQRE